MSYKDKLLHCIDCNKDYIFTVASQELLASKGYPNEPVRCPACRRARRNPNAQIDNNEKSTIRSASYFR